MAQAEWEARKALKDALANRHKMNKAIAHHFAYGAHASLATKFYTATPSATPTATPFASPSASPIASPIASPVRRMSGLPGLSPPPSPDAPPLRRGPSSREYEDRKRGLVQTGTWRVRIDEAPTEEVPGGRGIHVVAEDDWDFRAQLCPVAASRVVLTEVHPPPAAAPPPPPLRSPPPLGSPID